MQDQIPIAPKKCQKDVTCPQIEQTAERVVAKTMAVIGVDISDQESVNEFRDDLRFSRKIRKAGDHGFFTIIALLATALVMAAYLGVKSAFGIK